jgi:hypothetical protein
MCFYFLYNISHSRKNSESYYHILYVYIGLHLESPLFLQDFNQTWIFVTHFQKVLKYKIS